MPGLLFRLCLLAAGIWLVVRFWFYLLLGFTGLVLVFLICVAGSIWLSPPKPTRRRPRGMPRSRIVPAQPRHAERLSDIDVDLDIPWPTSRAR